MDLNHPAEEKKKLSDLSEISRVISRYAGRSQEPAGLHGQTFFQTRDPYGGLENRRKSHGAMKRACKVKST